MHAMLSGLLLWLGATACLFNHTSANFEKTCTTEDYYQQPRGLCGPKLSNILGIVCHNGYNKRANGKYGGKCRKTTVNNERFYWNDYSRPMTQAENNNYEHTLASAYFPLTRDLMDGGSKMGGAADAAGDQQVPSEQSHLARQSVFLPKASALAFLHDKRSAYMNDGNLRQGIVCECCIYQCTIGELQEYCAQPPK